jgi:asparagine N-glycosylation enzyme membrane subunit Stt3
MTSETSQRQKRVDRFIRAANIGTVAMIAYPVIHIALEMTLIGYKDDDPIVWPLLSILAAIVFLICEAYSIFSVFRHRNADEFTMAMWQNGTTFAFFAAILWLFIGGYVETIFDGLAAGRAYENAKAAGIDVEPLDGAGIVAGFATFVIISAFFLGLQLKRFRG